MFLNELVNAHSKFQLVSKATTGGISNRYDFNMSKLSVMMLLVIQSVTGGYGNIWSAWTNFVSGEESAETRYEICQAFHIFSYPPCNWLYNEFIPAMKVSSIHSLTLCKWLTNLSVPVGDLELFFFVFF
jgi:hypothetical protein